MRTAISPMIRWMLGAGLSSALLAQAAEIFLVPPDLWDRPRTARAVLEQPGVKRAVDAYLAQAGLSLVIHHAAGQESLLQAEELRAWLIALAVGPERVRLNGGLKSGELLRIEAIP